MIVLLFDGVCNLCNSSVNWLIDHDTKNKFHYASLQSQFGKDTAAKFQLHGNYMDTLVLLENDKIYLRSEAVLRIFKHLGGAYYLLYLFIIIPAFIRDFFYRIVANNRYSWFGKQDACRIPTAELRKKFLD